MKASNRKPLEIGWHLCNGSGLSYYYALRMTQFRNMSEEGAEELSNQQSASAWEKDSE